MWSGRGSGGILLLIMRWPIGAGVICAEVVVVVLVRVVRMGEVVGLGEASSLPASGGIPGGSIAPGGRTRPGATKPGGQSGQLGRQNNEPTILSPLRQWYSLLNVHLTSKLVATPVYMDTC